LRASFPVDHLRSYDRAWSKIARVVMRYSTETKSLMPEVNQCYLR